MARDAGPSRQLTRHFFDSLFDLGFLTEAGADSLRTLLLGILAFLVAIGLLLTRLLMAKYASLSAIGTPEPYRHALLANDALLLALPMLVVALVTVVLGHALFPDETDLRVLVPLPIPRRLIFRAKLVALARFAAIFIVGCHVALTPLMLLSSMSRWAEHFWLARVAAIWTAGVAASLFSLMTVAAAHGLVVTCVPAAYCRALSSVVRSTLLGGLVLMLPLILRLPALASEFGRQSPLTYALPPAWFLGVERVLLGDVGPYSARLALLASIAFTAVTLVTAASYLALYRRFDRVMLRAHRAMPSLFSWRGPSWLAGPPAAVALRAFTGRTLGRSPLHQGVLTGLYACGGALVVNTLAGHEVVAVLTGTTSATRGLVEASVGATLSAVFTGTLAVRLALLLPMNLRANWIFRMTESDPARPDQLRAVARALVRFGVVLPVAVLGPVLLAALGAPGLVAAAITVVAGLVLVEAVLIDWQRLPFTCTYLPGKRSLPQVVLLLFTAFVGFMTLGRAAVSIGLWSHTGASVVIAAALAVVIALRRRRLGQWRTVPLAFEDVSPYRVESMRLSVD